MCMVMMMCKVNGATWQMNGRKKMQMFCDMMIELWVTVRGHSTAGLSNDGDSVQIIIAKIKGHHAGLKWEELPKTVANDNIILLLL